ncbi:MAG: hypothetical protein FWF99_00205 [Desulfovibrionaceae bacterium]|nr:hypothetical protein [Desulfovibrionaceae bacterium]
MRKYFPYLILFLCLLLTGCSFFGKSDPEGAVDALGASGRKAEEKKRGILVAPFDCAVLPPEQSATTRLLQNMVSAALVYHLQSAGVQAEQYLPEGAPRVPVAGDYAALLPPSRPAGNLGSLAAVPIQEDGSVIIEDLPERSVPIVAPRDPGDTRQYGRDAWMEEKFFQPVAATREELLDIAKEKGFGHVLTGTIALVRTELSPGVYIGGKNRGTAQAELGCAFQLLRSGDGVADKLWAASGRDIKSVILPGGGLDDYQAAQVLDKVMRQAVRLFSMQAAEFLTGKPMGQMANDMDAEEERIYYQDSPGKRLRSPQGD